MRKLILAGATVGLLTVAASTAQAQNRDWDPERGHATRQALEQLMSRFELSATSPAYSSELREQARRQATQLRDRIARGDFRIGDVILLTVEREPTLSDTFTVAEGPVVVLPDIGEVSLAGVLRAELQNHLEAQITRFIRDPVVRARTLIRLSITGEVGTPGFYNMQSELIITDALMMAGGPSATAQLDDIRIERNSQEFWEPDALRQAIIEGRTLDQLNLQAGDRIVVPRRSGGLGSLESPLRAFSILMAIPFSIIAITQIF